jgi:hypothetical protein
VIRIGQEGHVSFLLLEPRVVGLEEVIQERGADGEPTLAYQRPIVDGTEESGETACHYGRVVGVDGDGLLALAGFNARGEPRQWAGVGEGAHPTATDDDPAGHVFHLAADCPEHR